MPQPTLHTPRITLVPLSDDHLDFEVELDSDAEVMRYLGGRPRIREEVEALHPRRIGRGRLVDGFGFWVGTVDGEPIGWWILAPGTSNERVDGPGQLELGYRLLRRHWRQGYASEGSRELLRYGFADAGITRVHADTMAVNKGSRATMKSVGMRYVRTYDEDGAAAVEYAITRDQWMALK
jgi:RimJ/RimL family protein N-acetyltransferase